MLRELVLATGLLAAGTLSAGAAPVTFSGTNGSNLSAEVSFDVVGTNLVVTLSNVGTAAKVPADLLTGVYFQIAGNPTLTRVSAVLPTGSTVINGTTTVFPSGTVVGGEWAYKASLSAPFTNPSYGISSSGLGIFGPGDVFPGGNLEGPADPDGPQYGVLPAAGIDAAANPTVQSTTLIKSKVVFTLGHAGAISSLPASAISNVQFQYGTALGEPRFGGGCTTNCGGGGPGPGTDVPAPAPLLLLGAALAGLGLSRALRA